MGGTGDEFAVTTVPESARTSAYSIAAMLLAANISLPSLVMGGRLGADLGFAATVKACFSGGVLLAILTAICAYAGARSRLTTYLLIVRAFGERGGAVVNLLLACSAIGWFAVVLMLFTDTMVRVAPGALMLWAVGGTVLMAWTTVIGFRALNWLSNVMLPAKLGLLIWAVWAAVSVHGTRFPAPPNTSAAMTDGAAIAFVVGGWVVGAVVAPDFTRYARQVGGGALACALALGVGYPVVLIAAAIPVMLGGDGSFLDAMAQLQMGFVAVAIVLLASWANGAINLYCGSLMLATVFRHRRRSVLVGIAAVTGVTLGIAGIAERLVPFLTVLSLVVPPIAGVYLPRFFLDERRGAPLPPRDWDTGAIAALAAGIAVAGMGQLTGRGLTGIGAIDALLVSAAAYLAMEALRGRLPARTSRRSRVNSAGAGSQPRPPSCGCPRQASGTGSSCGTSPHCR